nr:unnamed protein product [Callosobruchus chinensis]
MVIYTVGEGVPEFGCEPQAEAARTACQTGRSFRDQQDIPYSWQHSVVLSNHIRSIRLLPLQRHGSID